ncbi:MAG: glycerol-3-phosphate O-acyltransferase/dihydroxyacetone phosphate acyltransferase [Myxococcota bacterium]
MLIYRSIRTLLRAAVGVFFQQVHVVGLQNVPEDAPVVFAGNHPNSLIDPVVVLCTSGRIVHFAAKDKLFAWPLGPILLALGAVPIARKMDYADGKPRDNEDALSALKDALGARRCIGIFPEGLSHDGSELARLRSGAARIAVGLVADRPMLPLVVVPTGLTYVHRKSFRSRVLVQYGPPISVTPAHLEAWRADPRAAARALTDEIEAAIRALTVNAPDWDTLRVLDGVRRLYQPPRIDLRDRVELARRFCAVYPTVADQPAVQALWHEVAAYLDRLDDAGLTDRDLVRSDVANRSFGHLVALCVWLPLALPGLPVHVPLGVLVGWAGVQFAPRKDVVGTSRLVGGLVAVGAVYLLLPVLVWAWLGTTAAAIVAVMLPVSGYATLRVLERGTSLRRLLRSARHALHLRRVVAELRDERARLEVRVVDTVRAFLPKDLAPLFPERLAGATGEDGPPSGA